MSAHEQPQRDDGGTIRVGGGPGGAVTYLVDLPPEALPTVYKRDLELAWYAARDAAIADHRGAVRAFRFNRPDGSHTDLALADRDASCWVSAVDRTVGLATTRGMSLCLRLLALIDLLAHAAWARPLFHLARDGAEFHPALLRAAASQPLTQDARFDEAGFRLRLSRFATGFQLEAPPAAGQAANDQLRPGDHRGTNEPGATRDQGPPDDHRPTADSRQAGDERRSADAREATNPSLAMGPGLAPRPQLATRPGLATRPRLAAGPSVAADPSLAADPRVSADPDLAADPSISADPNFSGARS